MAEDITERLRTNTCRYAAETEQEAAKRRIAVDLEAANEIDSLRAQLASAELSADELRRQRDDADARIAGWRSRAEAAEAAIASARKALEEITGHAQSEQSAPSLPPERSNETGKTIQALVRLGPPQGEAAPRHAPVHSAMEAGLTY